MAKVPNSKTTGKSGGGAGAGDKVLVFAPQEPGSFTANENELEAAGCELVQGLPAWHTPNSNKGAEMAAMTAGADAIMGTSIRVNPITRQVMEASDNLRIVAKYTIGYDDVDVEAATDLGIIVTHSPTEANWGGWYCNVCHDRRGMNGKQTCGSSGCHRHGGKL